MRNTKVLLSAVLISLLGARLSAEAPAYDIVITGARVVTGDGSPAFIADVGIRGDRIAAIGPLRVPPGARMIRARGRVLSPGFIDIHTHAEDGLLEFPTAANYLLQGVTTVVGGNCGSSPWPLADLFDRIEHGGTAVNFASFSGHNTLRARVMGRKTAAPSPREMRLMREMLDRDMRAGAMGLSTGLTYFPGRHAALREIAALAEVIAPYGGVYATHMRSEGRDIALALEEAARIGERAGVRVQVSHLKLSGDSVRGHPHLILERLEAARRRGVRMTADLYPYTASSTGFSTWFPHWARPVLRSRSTSSPAYLRLKARLARAFNGELDRFVVGSCPACPEFEGKSFDEILTSRGIDPCAQNAAELLIDIQRRGRVQGIFFFMLESDVEALLRLEGVMVASDGEIVGWQEGHPHCRSYGTFPRILARFVREKKILSLEEAVRKMTALPARSLGLRERGLIRKGAYADLVLFDPRSVRDTATYARPHGYPEGILWVMVNGRLAAENGRATGALTGRVIRGRRGE